MPPEDLPPLAPFPDLTAPAPANTAAPEPAVEPPLLSAAQREEFASIAGTLEGLTLPVPTGGSGAACEDAFLLTPADRPPSEITTGVSLLEKGRAALPEEPVQAVDFLAVAGTVELPDGAFSLQSLAASLTNDAPAPGGIRPPAASGDGDWGMPFLSALESPSAAAPNPQPPVMAKLTPVALEASRSMSSGPVKAENVFPERVVFPPPRVAEPDFDEQLRYPVPSALEPLPPERPVDQAERSMALVLSGALLIVLGIVKACRLPSLAQEADARASGGALVAAWHLQGEMLVSAAGAAGCLLLGIGAATLRRWAPPLIHAAGWVVLFTVLVCMGLASASMFYLSSNETPGDAVPGEGTALFAAAGLLGIGLPLGLIALFQRPSVLRLCMAADRKPCWTDARSVPSLMVFITGLGMAAAYFALAVSRTQTPAFGPALSDGAAVLTWSLAGAGAVAGAVLAAMGRRAGWSLLTVLTAVTTVSLFLTCQRTGWRALLHLPASEGGTAEALMAAAVTLPPLLVLLMTRRAWRHQEWEGD